MSGGPHIRAVGPEAAQDALDEATVSAEIDDVLETSLADEVTETFVENSEFDEGYVAGDVLEERSRFEWLFPAIAITAVVVWTGFYIWALRGEILSGASIPQLWTRWIIDWSVPVLLVGIAWLLAMRNSNREAKRFARTAAILSKESAELETRLGVVNRELSLAREFLNSQSLELESLGRVASERISSHASELQQLIKNNGDQVDKIGSASDTALSNMSKLRDDLPVIATSARDVSNQVGNAGRTAQDQLNSLVGGFERLNEFGEASERQVQSLSDRVDTTLSGFEAQLEQLERVTKARFGALNEKSETYRTELDSREVNALAAMRQRADDLRAGLSELDSDFAAQEEKSLTSLKARIALLRGEGETAAANLRKAESAAIEALRQSKDRLNQEIGEVVENLDTLHTRAVSTGVARIGSLEAELGRFDSRIAERDLKFVEELNKRQDEFDTRETQAAALLAERLAELDDSLAERREAQIAETEKLVGHSKEIGEQLDQLNSLFADITTQGETAQSSLSSGISSLDEQLTENRVGLSETESQLATLTESGIRLLEIIQSGARQSREDLNQAIQASTEQLSAVEERATKLTSTISEVNSRGDSLSEQIAATQSNIEIADTQIEALQTKLADQSDETLAKLQGMRSGLAKLTADAGEFSGEAQDTLRAAIGTLESATQSAFTTIEDGTRERIAHMAENLGAEAVDALDRALRSESAEAIGRFEQTAAHASGVGREAAIQLRDQLAKVNELTGNLEQRVARARELAQEQTNNDFSRRMALITDSLNSNAIDITTALATEVSDTAWDAYLKGDRGIFTRRAVNLIDSGEAREISELYQSDDAFRNNVSRYIHDFESMLRSMLSTKDGNALSVTLLGSDMGKLYVLMAQAIERFRN
ncbi:MAG: ATPase [Erythrobacter sp.]